MRGTAIEHKKIHLASLPANRDVGPKDCRICVKRRIRCDRSTPKCFKCTSRGLSCPGFDPIQLKWGQGLASRGQWKGQNSPVHVDIVPSNSNVYIVHDKHLTSGPANVDTNKSLLESEGAQRALCSRISCMIDAPGLLRRSSWTTLCDRLVNYFHQQVVPRLTWIDSSDNSWRRLISPLAQHSCCLQMSILSVAAAHSAATVSSDGQTKSFLQHTSNTLLHRCLQSLSRKMEATLHNSSESQSPSGRRSLTEILATILALCHREMFVPDSTSWNLHLRACRIVISQLQGLDNEAANHGDATKFLMKEVMDLEAFKTVSAFSEQQGWSPTTIRDSPSDDHFWTFTSLIREITVRERQQHRLLQYGQSCATADMRVWRTKIEDAYSLASCGAISLLPPDEETQNCFAAVVRAHFYAALIYGYQALCHSLETRQMVCQLTDQLFVEIKSYVTLSARDFSHDLFFPLFIAGTECGKDAHKQSIIQNLFRQSIYSTGFWCNKAGLQFLRSFWTKQIDGPADTWIQHARDYYRQFGPFLVF